MLWRGISTRGVVVLPSAIIARGNEIIKRQACCYGNLEETTGREYTVPSFCFVLHLYFRAPNWTSLSTDVLLPRHPDFRNHHGVCRLDVGSVIPAGCPEMMTTTCIFHRYFLLELNWRGIMSSRYSYPSINRFEGEAFSSHILFGTRPHPRRYAISPTRWINSTL